MLVFRLTLATRRVRQRWIEFTKKTFDREETSTRPWGRSERETPSEESINSRTCNLQKPTCWLVKMENTYIFVSKSAHLCIHSERWGSRRCGRKQVNQISDKKRTKEKNKLYKKKRWNKNIQRDLSIVWRWQRVKEECIFIY